MAKFFTADTHFGHKGVITHCNRPFETTDEMNRELVKRWNSKVKPGDDVYHLGDYSHLRRDHAMLVLKRLNGNICLIRGNHDTKRVNGPLAAMFGFVKNYYELKIEEQTLVLFHYPIDSWFKKHYGSWHLHGHSHGRMPPGDRLRLDVGVDTNDFYPYSWEEIKAKLKN